MTETEPQGAPQDADLEPKSSTDESTGDDTQADTQVTEDEGMADYQEEGAEKAAADYQARMDEWDNADASAPVVSLPVETGGKLDKSDLEV